MLKNFQEAFVQHIVGLIDVGHIPQTNALGVTIVLPEQRSLGPNVVCSASFDNTQQVVIGERRTASKKHERWQIK